MFEIELLVCIKMDFELNSQQRLICHKTKQTTKNKRVDTSKTLNNQKTNINPINPETARLEPYPGSWLKIRLAQTEILTHILVTRVPSGIIQWQVQMKI